MTPETYEFWKMVLTSPVTIALAGGIAGSGITLAIALFKFRHDAKESQKAWERQEATRKEERAFDRKSKAYEDFFTCFETTWGEGISNFDKHFAPSIMSLMLYGPLPVKMSARASLESLIAAMQYSPESAEYKKCMEESKLHCNDIHTAMMEDMDIHFACDDIRC